MSSFVKWLESNVSEDWNTTRDSWHVQITCKDNADSASNAVKLQGLLHAVSLELSMPLPTTVETETCRTVLAMSCGPPSGASSWCHWLFRSEDTNAQQMIKSVTAPRKLRLGEIHTILRSFANVGSAPPPIHSCASSVNFPEIWKHTIRSVYESLFAGLSAVTVPPACHLELEQDILRQFKTSIVARGEAVGIRAAEAFGQPLTQMALNAFHSSGALNTIGEDNIVKMRELFNNSLQMKNETCRVGFTGVTTLHEALLRKKDITDTRLNKFFKKEPMLLERPSLFSEAYPDATARMLNEFSELREVVLQSQQLHARNMVTEYGTTYFLRLFLDVDIMYQFRLTTHDIVRQIEENCVLGNVVHFRLYPSHTGLVDIYPMGPTASSRDLARVFLSCVLLPELINIRMCGIPGIENIIPEEVNVSNAVIDSHVPRALWCGLCREVDELSPNWTHLTFVNVCKLALHRLRVYDVERLLSAISANRFKRLECAHQCPTHSDKYIVYATMPLTLDEISVKCNVTGGAAAVLDENRKACEQLTAEELSDHLPPKVVMQLLSSYNMLPEINMIFVSTVGANLESLIMRDDVDTSVTYSNNIRLVNEIFGIEAARSVLITEFWKLLERSGSKISPRHVLLVADFMTNRGVVLGLTSSGLSLQPSATLTLMTFERPADHIFRMGMTGNEETINSVSSCVMTGQPPMVGTGASGVSVTHDSLESGQSREHQDRFLAGTYPFGRGRQKPVPWKRQQTASRAQSASATNKSTTSGPSASTSSSLVTDTTFEEFDSDATHSENKNEGGKKVGVAVDAGIFDEFDEEQPSAGDDVVAEGVTDAATDAAPDLPTDGPILEDDDGDRADLPQESEVADLVEDMNVDGEENDEDVEDIQENEDEFDTALDEGADDYLAEDGGAFVDSSWNE